MDALSDTGCFPGIEPDESISFAGVAPESEYKLAEYLRFRNFRKQYTTLSAGHYAGHRRTGYDLPPQNAVQRGEISCSRQVENARRSLLWSDLHYINGPDLYQLRPQ